MASVVWFQRWHDAPKYSLQYTLYHAVLRTLADLDLDQQMKIDEKNYRFEHLNFMQT